jgi:hypothetical protein
MTGRTARSLHKKVRAGLPLVVACLLGILCWLLLARYAAIGAEVLDSPLPTPKPQAPRRTSPPPGYVQSATGGQVFCGLEQSSAWIEIPRGFSTQDAAEFHCDPTGSLSAWSGTAGAWDDRGYLIGFWPTTAPIKKAFSLVLEIDPSRLEGPCDNCFDARYLDPATHSWKSLPASYNAGVARVSAQIDSYLPASHYPDFEDRFLIALFVKSTSPTPATTSAPPPTQGPTSTLPPAATSAPPSTTPSAPLVEIPTPQAGPTRLIPSPETPTETPVTPATVTRGTTPTVSTSGGSTLGTLLLIAILGAVVVVCGILIAVTRKRQVTRHSQRRPIKSEKHPGPTIELILLRGRAQPPGLVLSQTLVRIGRSPEGNDIVVDDAPVSAHHAEIRWDEERHAIQDLNSTNGTFVNDRRLAAPHPLHDGDRIVMGNTEWLYQRKGGTLSMARQ